MYSDARFLYVSSVNVYGIHNDIITENSSFNSPSLYGRSKLASEFIVSSCKSYAIIRFTYLYGPHLNNNSFLPTIIGQALSKKTIGLMGEGKRSQDYLYVTDAARLCVEALHSTLNDVYLGASGKSYSNFEIGKIICDNVPGCEITFSGTENGVSFHINPAHAMKTLNWVPEVDINSGIKQCLI
jgi:UDP-glucose 4-epimerase